MKRKRRDPPSLMQLRRLYYRASRASAKAFKHDAVVLHDALLEAFPEAYGEEIEKAHERAEDSKREQLVFFKGDKLRLRHLRDPMAARLMLFTRHQRAGEGWGKRQGPADTFALQRLMKEGTMSDPGVIVYRTRGYL